jgi:Fe-S cluster biosynthesis and repair protein YggX
MRLVFCRKYQQELEGLEKPPFPGAIGEELYKHVSAKAWSEWQQYQIMIINERSLNMANKEDRKFISQQMQEFLSNGNFVKVTGYQQ